jgi:hypothetical protein
MSDQYDIFISHASEDKSELVFPLASLLADLGVKVWYDEFELRVGDSLSGSIDKGLANSSFGAVVISKAFLAKKWPEYELRGLITKELESEKVILPIWHKVDRTLIAQSSPTLADKFALNSGDLNIEEIAVKLIEVCRPDLFKVISRIKMLRKLEASRPIHYLPLKDLKPSPHRRTQLPEGLIVRTHLFYAVAKDVIPLSFEEAIDGFLRDTDPTREVEIFERISACYFLATRGKTFRLEKKREIYSVLIRVSSGPLREEDYLRPKYLSRKEIQDLEILYGLPLGDP